jgi:hypothetical protein
LIRRTEEDYLSVSKYRYGLIENNYHEQFLKRHNYYIAGYAALSVGFIIGVLIWFALHEILKENYISIAYLVSFTFSTTFIYQLIFRKHLPALIYDRLEKRAIELHHSGYLRYIQWEGGAGKYVMNNFINEEQEIIPAEDKGDPYVNPRYPTNIYPKDNGTIH